MKYLQKLGKSIMLPVACLPLCGILMGIGYLLCPASMQGGEISGAGPVIGMFLVKAGGALIDHIALLFAVGIGVGMSDDKNGTAGITALVSWLILPLGLAAFAVFYLTFRLLIRRFDLHTPGNEAEEPAPAGKAAVPAGQDAVAGVDLTSLLAGLGGAENIRTLDNCATRLRLELKDFSLLDEQTLKAAGAKGVIKPGKNSVQVIIGLKVQAVADALHERLR